MTISVVYSIVGSVAAMKVGIGVKSDAELSGAYHATIGSQTRVALIADLIAFGPNSKASDDSRALLSVSFK